MLFKKIIYNFGLENDANINDALIYYKRAMDNGFKAAENKLRENNKNPHKVALISATADDIKHFACFRDYIIVNPHIDERYNRNIYVNKLIPDATEQRAAIVNLIDTKRMNYDKVLVKIEDKKECKILKKLLKDRYKVALYTADDKEIVLNEDGLFDKNVDVIISTSSIQNGQSIKENILSIFVQTYIDIVSSIEQFLGRSYRLLGIEYFLMFICFPYRTYTYENVKLINDLVVCHLYHLNIH